MTITIRKLQELLKGHHPDKEVFCLLVGEIEPFEVKGLENQEDSVYLIVK